jgi:hypothetical protein
MAYPRVTVPAVRGYPRVRGIVPIAYLPSTMAIAPALRRRAATLQARVSGYSRSSSSGLGQSLVDDIGSLFAPNPGGGSVTVDGTTTYVNSAGSDQATVDPNAGATLNPFSSDPGTHFDPLGVLSEDVQGVAASTPGLDLFVSNPQSPTKAPLPGWLLPVGAGVAGLLVLKFLL